MIESEQHDSPDLFPYPVSKGEKESPATTWVRNHSSYLTVGGFLNYLQVAGVYIRGILLNLVVLAPVILVAAMIPAFFHHWLLNHPFAATGFASLLFVLAIAVFLANGPYSLIRAISQRLAGDHNRDGSLARLGREQLIAWAILALFVGISIDVTPRLIEFARQNQGSLQLNWPNVSALIVGIATLVGTASRFLDRFESTKASYAVAIVGLTSLSIPYLLLLGVANYLVYGIIPTRSMYAWLTFICVIAFTVSLFIALRIRSTKAMPTTNKRFGFAVTTGFAIAIGFLAFAAHRSGNQSAIVSEFVGEVTRPLSRLASVKVPKEKKLADTPAFQELVDKYELLNSFGKVRFTTHGVVLSESPLFSFLRPSSWLNWLDDRDADAEYFLAASDFIEAGERIDSLDSVSKLRLLHLGADEAFRTIVQAERKKTLVEGEAESRSPNNAILAECLRSKLAITAERREELATLTLDELHAVTSDTDAMQRDYQAITLRRLPERLSTTFLERTGRKPTSESEEKGALDVNLSGPFLLENLQRSEFDSAWGEEMWLTCLAASTDVDLWATDTAKQLSGVSGFSIGKAGDVVEEAKRRQVASAFTTEQCMQLLDQKDVIHRHIPNAGIAGANASLPGDVSVATKSLGQFLKRPWSTQRGGDVEKELSAFCSRLKLGTSDAFRVSCFDVLLYQAVNDQDVTGVAARIALAELFNPSIVIESVPEGMDPLGVYRVKAGEQMSDRSLKRLAAIRFTNIDKSEPILRRIVLGEFGNLQGLSGMKERVFERAFWSKGIFILVTATLLLIVAWLYIDINRTSAHGFYRDRLSRAFLFDIDCNGQVSPAFDVRLSELGNYSSGSVAPFQLINCAVNLQGSPDLEIRAEKSDFFTFNAVYAGSDRTGYVPIEVLEEACPSLSVGTAMAISAGAASPNMGRNTNSLLVFLMTFANLRLGYWLPNPRKVVQDLSENGKLKNRKLLDLTDVRVLEISKIKDRRKNLDPAGQESFDGVTDVEGSLCGLACSGGGIRSAAINLGIAQALHAAEIFPLFDLLSTVSGGGYFGSSVSTSMRARSSQEALRPIGNANDRESPSFENGFDPWVTGYRWITRPTHYLKEMTSWLSQDDTWINLSDGGHVENLGFYELLRRRCRFIVVGDGEADPDLEFPSLTFAIQAARARLNTTIQWVPESIHLWSQSAASSHSKRPHHALGRIQYPGDSRPAFVLYLKSSVNDDEPADVRGYDRQHEAFPHESTADQFFDPSQFEAYRELGKHIAESALAAIGPIERSEDAKSISFTSLINKLDVLCPDPAAISDE
ncbi:patatin-like phospholipase family protein [Allorhodopirellula heiligendammensis]|uniref:Patatin-like phospholipase n=1 Tax=Allorhodopirellula heiligendammensis TaxID=2714739 RepID=A0A5C6C168_9BACT|nr:patatin-like phospholipase family protein [Allorhodopirellula heiligendammensis]TWU17872.1 hypothetical protein Poly21_00230 [Allorhodopirellula heiligendammensis]